ncbi:MAG: F0F1 ATP synthase subunit B [Anaerolineae bacterium]|nr:F0F1 ATP synthase subunit B [Anaerolineae bacterium]
MDALGINLGFFIAQLVNFGIVFFLLARFVWPRVIDMLDNRAERIAKGLEDAQAAEEARENAERERDKLLTHARADAQKILDEARQRGEEQVKGILRKAETDAEDRRAQARVQAEEERNRILSETRSQIISLSMAAAERLVGEALDEKRQRAVLQDFFAGVPAAAKGIGQRITVVSALPLTGEEQSKVQNMTGAEQIEYRVDPAILGGLIIRAGDKVVDGSVRANLSTLKAQLN